jgi:hypothetical protein
MILAFTEQKINKRNNRKYNNQNYKFEKTITKSQALSLVWQQKLL